MKEIMNNPLVSVIIPNYNHARFLDERFQSILNQTYQNFEVIILDDKSTDNSVEVINKYKDNPHVSHVVVNEENSGSTFKQWHKGFELAKGELIWIAESDDSCDSGLLETLIRGFIDNDAVLAFCRSCEYSIDGIKRLYQNQTNLLHDIVLDGKHFISEYMIDRNSVSNASSAIMSRQIATSIDKQYMNMRAEGDWLFWVEIMEHGNVFFCTKEMNYFRMHNSNSTKSYFYKGISVIEHKITFDYLVKHGYLTRLKSKYERLRLLDSWAGIEFESTKVKRRIFNTWDRFRIWRLYLLVGNIKKCLKLIASLL